jgi:hypothetical protein
MLQSQIATDPAIPRLTVRALLGDMVGAVRGHATWFLAAFAVLALASVDPGPWLGSGAAIKLLHFAYRDVVLGALVAGWVALVMFAHARDRKLTPLQAVVRSLRRLLPLVAAGVLVLTICTTGLLLLVVPGLIWMAALMPLLPIVMVERLGPEDAIRESFAMTKGHRAPILVGGLAILVLVLLFAIVLSACTGVAMGIVGWSDIGLAEALLDGPVWAAIGLTASLYSAVVYLRLRRLTPDWTAPSRENRATAGGFEHLAPVCVPAEAGQRGA